MLPLEKKKKLEYKTQSRSVVVTRGFSATESLKRVETGSVRFRVYDDFDSLGRGIDQIKLNPILVRFRSVVGFRW